MTRKQQRKSSCWKSKQIKRIERRISEIYESQHSVWRGRKNINEQEEVLHENKKVKTVKTSGETQQILQGQFVWKIHQNPPSRPRFENSRKEKIST